MNLSAYEGTVAAGIVPWIEGDRSFESGLELSKETSFEGKGSPLGGGVRRKVAWRSHRTWGGRHGGVTDVR